MCESQVQLTGARRLQFGVHLYAPCRNYFLMLMPFGVQSSAVRSLPRISASFYDILSHVQYSDNVSTSVECSYVMQYSDNTDVYNCSIYMCVCI